MVQEDYESFLTQQVENILCLKNRTGTNIDCLVEAYVAGIETGKSESFKYFEGGNDLEIFSKELKSAVKDYEDSLVKRAHEQFPGEHVFFEGNRIAAHGQDAKETYTEYLKNRPQAEESFSLHVRPKGEELKMRKYFSRPRGKRR